MTTQWLHRDESDGWLGYMLEAGVLGMHGATGKGNETLSVIVSITPEQVIQIGREMVELGEYLIAYNMGNSSHHATMDETGKRPSGSTDPPAYP